MTVLKIILHSYKLTEVYRMEVQFANEVSQRGEMGDKLRKTCLMMLEERLAKICREKDAELASLTKKTQEEAETMHERCVSSL